MEHTSRVAQTRLNRERVRAVKEVRRIAEESLQKTRRLEQARRSSSSKLPSARSE
jgi:hypothetical protein